MTAARPRPGAYPVRASLAQLAADTAASLRGQGTLAITVGVDDSLFAGPAASTAWEPTYVRSGVVAPVAALMVDQARIRKGSDTRHADPALAAGRLFARLLASEGIQVQGAPTRTTSKPPATVLASARSAPVGTLVESMLATSDNDLAEALARLVAGEVAGDASFVGISKAVPLALLRAGLPAVSMRLLDGSGLARKSKVSPRFVTRLVALATRDARLGPLLTGLPVAGFSGTLADRFDSGGASSGAGLVRAKTGTLTGVAGLAGIASTTAGELVVFAVLSEGLAPSQALRARNGLDLLAATLSGQGQRMRASG